MRIVASIVCAAAVSVGCRNGSRSNEDGVAPKSSAAPALDASSAPTGTASTQGGSAASAGTDAGRLSFVPRVFAIGPTHVYFITDTGALARVPLAGGNVETCAPGFDHAMGMAVDGDGILVLAGIASDTGLLRVRCSDHRVEELKRFANQHPCYEGALVSAPTGAFALTCTGSLSRPGALAVEVALVNAEAVRQLARIEGDSAIGASASADGLYVSLQARHKIVFAPNDGGAVRDAVQVGDDDGAPHSLVVDGPRLLWTDALRGRILSWDRDGRHPATVLVSGQKEPAGLAVIPKGFVWMNAPQPFTHWTVMRKIGDEKPTKLLERDGTVPELAVRANVAYWSADGHVDRADLGDAEKRERR